MEILNENFKLLKQTYCFDSGYGVAYVKFYARLKPKTWSDGTTSSQNNVLNKSNVEFKGVIEGGSWYASGCQYSIDYNPMQNVGYVQNRFEITVEREISHDEEGKATNIASGFFFSADGWGSASANANFDLPTIPRASQIGVANANIGQSTVITINKVNDAFTTSLYYRVSGDTTWNLIVEKTNQSSYAWQVPTTFYSLIPNSKTIDVEFKGITYQDETELGTSQIITGTFTATGNPTITQKTFRTTNFNNLTGNSTSVIKYASNVLITVTAEAINQATISKILVNGNEATLTTSGNSKTGTITLNAVTSSYFEINVIDSRGNSTNDYILQSIVEYYPLSVNGSVERNQPTDNKVKINMNGTYFATDFGATTNSLTLQYRYKIKDSSDDYTNWATIPSSSITIDSQTSKYNVTNYLVSNINYNNIYDFQLRATDKVFDKFIEGFIIKKGRPLTNWCDDYYNFNTDIRQNNESIWDILQNDYLSDLFNIETSSNNDCTSLKFSNGLLINYGKVSMTTGATTSTMGGITLASTYATVNFPVNFKQNTSYSTITSVELANMAVFCDSYASFMNDDSLNLNLQSTSTNYTRNVMFIAIGVWK